jgi:glycyl-radical enzyme activating protein/glucokinase-like ROK family protein
MGDWVIGVDLGGTKIEVGLVDPHNQIAGRRRMETRPHEGPAAVVDRIVQAVQELSSLVPHNESIAALGICSPGPVDHETGTLIDPPNLHGLHNAPLQQMLSNRLRIPVRLEHDAKATALGEYYYGAGQGARSMVFLIVGTGVGAAIIDNGQLIRGMYNGAGEIGHITLDRDGEPCSCGARGCVETFVSGPWLARRFQKALEAQGRREAIRIDGAITGETVALLAAQGEQLALHTMKEAGEALGIAVATMAMLFDVDLFVVGGSVAKAGDLLLEPARRELSQHAYRSVGSGVRLIASEIGDDGPILGCAWLARQAAVGQELRAAGQDHPLSVGLHEAFQAEPSLASVEGVIFDIQRFSVHDGPGIRTSVFLKGCTLRCAWCANPESQRPQPELAFTESRCIRCGQFLDPCADGWVSGETLASRKKYGERVNDCPTCGIRWMGTRQTAGEILEEVLKDRAFYENGGGLTLTGGEPTFQPHFSEAVLRLAKAAQINTAMETTGHTRWNILERLIPYLDHILFDVKHLDGEKHRQYTGADNVLILANLRRLAEARAPVEIRVPLIPGFNADVDSLAQIANFVMETQGLEKEVCLLPYHAFGQSKYHALGRLYPWKGVDPISDESVEALAEVFRSRDLRVRIGGM